MNDTLVKSVGVDNKVEYDFEMAQLCSTGTGTAPIDEEFGECLIVGEICYDHPTFLYNL